MALWLLVQQLLLPLLKALNYLFTSVQLQPARSRALSISLGTTVLVLALLTLVPAPLYTVAQGVVWLPEQSHIRTQVDGFVATVAATTGQQLSAGTELLTMSNAGLINSGRAVNAKLLQLKNKQQQARVSDLLAADIIEDQIAALTAELSRVNAFIKALRVVSSGAGTLVITDSQNLPGKYLSRGSSLGYIFTDNMTRVRIMVPQANIALVREQTQSVEVRMANRQSEVINAVVEREIPSGLNRLPSRALGHTGGGLIATQPGDADGLETLDPHFLIELRLSQRSDIIGQRAYARFFHGMEPLAQQWYRRISQAFLDRPGG
ncbi:MAG: putative peptide zinc metalloprotease protein [Paraglaciecola psychrophila]